MGDYMSSTLTQDTGMFGFDTAAVAGTAVPPVKTAGPEAPVGYRWIAKRWRVLPDGTRDYAAYHGKTEFKFLLPVSSKLHAGKY